MECPDALLGGPRAGDELPHTGVRAYRTVERDQLSTDVRPDWPAAQGAPGEGTPAGSGENVVVTYGPGGGRVDH